MQYSINRSRIFCNSLFWNQTLSWNSDTPRLTECFSQTVLPAIPLTILLVLLPYDIYIVRSFNRQLPPIPFQWKNILILLTIICLSIIETIEISKTLWNYFSNEINLLIISELFSPLIKLITYLLVAILVLFFRNNGYKHSVSIPIQWLCSLLIGIINLYQVLFINEVNIDIFVYILELIEFSLTLILLIISCLSPEVTTFQSLNSDSYPKCPITEYNVFSRIFYIWVTKLLKDGYKRDISQHLLQFCWYQRSKNSYKDFEVADKKYNTNRPLNSKRLLPLIWSTIWWPYISGLFLIVCEIGFKFIEPYLLSKLIDFVSGEDTYEWHGIFYAIAFCIFNLLARLMDCHFYMRFQLVAYRVQTSLTTAVYKKILNLSPDSGQKYNKGDIKNIVEVHIIELSKFCQGSYNLISIPINISIGSYILWQYLGLSSLTLFVVVLIYVFLVTIIMKRIGSIQSLRMELKDKRIKQLTEILYNIKLLKLFGWEIPFMGRVSQTRAKELNKQIILHLYWSIIKVLFIVFPFLTLGLIFIVFTIIEDQPLTPKTAFVSFFVLSLLRQPFVDFPNVLSQLVRALVSYQKIKNLLNSEELEEVIKDKSNESDESAVLMNNCSFSWSISEEPVLRNIDLNIKKGYLVAIVGRVGSGKSSIFSAILGDMYQRAGNQCQVSGSVAYVPQTAWIQNTSLRENITFMNNLNIEKYEEVVNACALRPDFDLLPERDMTQIGEKGINLSDGQKQKVSLARAVYQETDIYFLDDPLSTVDAQVSQHLFYKVIGPTGLLNKKTRLLTTNNLSFLKVVDYIIVMSGGRIVCSGSYQELSKSSFLNKQISDDSESSSSSSENSISYSSSKISQKQSVSSKNESLKGKMEREVQRVQFTDEEQPLLGSIGFYTYFNYFSHFGILLTIVPLLTTIILNSCEIGNNFFLNIWSSQNSTQIEDPYNKKEFLSIYLSVIALNAIFVAISQITFRLGSIKAATKLHHNMLSSVMRAPLLFFDVTLMGGIINRFSSDFERIDNEIPMCILSSISLLIWFIIIIGIIIYFNPLMIIQTLIVIIIIVFQFKYYSWTSRQLYRLESATRSPINNHFDDSIAGTVSIKAYGVQQMFLEKLQKLMDININVNKHIFLTIIWIHLWSAIFGTVITLSIAMFVVLKSDQLTQGFTGFILIYSIEMINSFSWALRSGAQVQDSMVSVKRVQEYSELKAEAEWESVFKPPKNWPTKGKIKFVKYCARYRPELDLVLRDLNFKVKRGKRIGIVGRTGAGKSSITLALFRIIEASSGKILIDGVDISRIGLHDLRSKITIIPQEPNLFAGTLRLNLDPLNEYTDEKLWLALESAHLKDFFINSSDGLSYNISEGGDNLSGGQRQLVCLARALLRETKILVLDEATAACDLETDRLIQLTIKEKFKEWTVITIAHRLNTILDYNKILVLDNGTIVEMGSPKNLLQRSDSHFYSLAKELGIILKRERSSSCCNSFGN